MVVVPAGAFTMGSPAEEEGSQHNEAPQRQVTIGYAFAAGRSAVTRAEYDAFVKETGYALGPSCRTLGKPDEVFAGEPTPGRSVHDPGFPQDDRHPAVCVSWDDAKAYAAWLSGKTGKVYRLLTEAEWEYAARAGAQTRFFFGDDEKRLCTFGNVGDQTYKEVYFKKPISECRDGYVFTAPIGSFPPNAFGLHDMIGNVWSLVEDCLTWNYKGARSDGRAVTTGEDCSSRMTRGGSFNDDSWFARSASRQWAPTGERNVTIGFRVARAL
jgi:formylglycine-generating enzyme required for sulfatase activity